MSRSIALGCVLVSAWSALLGSAGCAASRSGRDASTGSSSQRGEAVGGDGARCEYKGRTDREISESAGTGALVPSIRRVYRILGEGEQRRRILVCREVDTNLDGTKDLVRRYNDQGEATEEQADANYDGKVDTWLRFAKGRIAQVDVDSNQDDSPDETRYYVQGKLSRVQRDTNGDGRPDVWEIYAAGHLERMGVDVDHDGRVDRWNRDEVSARAQAAAEAEGEAASPAAAAGAAGQSGDGAEAP